MSDKNISGTTSYEQLVNPRLKSDTVRSKLAVAEENAYYNETSINNYGYEIDTEEAYPYPEECEEGFEFCKSKKKPYVQRSRSILEEDAFSEIVLTAVEARKCLNRIGQVGSGLIYAFVQIDIDHRSLTNIEEIINFKYLSFINVSHNNLNLDALDVLRELEYVVVVRADHNNVDSLCLSPMPYLQVLTLNSNRVSSLSGLKQPSLECLELNDNNISSLIQVSSRKYNKNYCNEEIACPNLSTLALSRNALDTVEEFVILSNQLRILYLSYNKITKLNGLGDLQNLSRLHLRGNQISDLDGFTDNLKYLVYLNLRENRLSDVEELNKLVCLKSLKTLVVSDNNFSNISIRSKVLKLLPWLERIDKGTVSKAEYESEKFDENDDQEDEEEE